MRHSEIVISRFANGYAVTMPGQVPDRYPYDAETSMAETIRQMMPAAKDLMKSLHADPLLEELQRDAEPEPEPKPAPEKGPCVGKNSDTYVFADWEGVLEFLSSLELE